MRFTLKGLEQLLLFLKLLFSAVKLDLNLFVKLVILMRFCKSSDSLLKLLRNVLSVYFLVFLEESVDEFAKNLFSTVWKRFLGQSYVRKLASVMISENSGHVRINLVL